MAYSRNIPQPDDLPPQTQPLLLGNFQAIYDVFGVDHSPFNDRNQGRHNKASLVTQNDDPVLVNDEIILWAKEIDNRKELMIGANGKKVPITQNGSLDLGGGKFKGFAYTSAGLLYKWGRDQTNAQGIKTIDTDAGIGVPQGSKILNISVTGIEGNNKVHAIPSNINGLEFDVITYDVDNLVNRIANGEFYWFVIALPNI